MSKIIKLVQLMQNRPVIVEHSLPGLDEEHARLELEEAEEAPRVPEISPEEMARLEGERILMEAEGRAREMVEKAKEEAEALLAKAKEDAESLRSTTERQAEALLEHSRKEGYEKGYAEAIEAARAEAEAIVAAARQEAEEAYRQKEAYLKAKEPEMIDLALAIAEKILRHEVDRREDAILPIARRALEKAGGGKVILKINSQDYPVVQAHQRDLLAAFPQLEEIAVQQDDRIERGGCIVETESGFLDARLSTQFVQIVEALTKVVS